MKTLKNQQFIAGFRIGICLGITLTCLTLHLTQTHMKHEKPPTQILTSPTFNPAWSHSDAPGATRSPGHSQIGKPETLTPGGLFSNPELLNHNVLFPKSGHRLNFSHIETNSARAPGNGQAQNYIPCWVIGAGLFNIIDIIIFHGAEYSLAALARTEEAGARPGWLSRSWNLSHFGNFQGSFPLWDTVCNGVAFAKVAWACDVMTRTPLKPVYSGKQIYSRL